MSLFTTKQMLLYKPLMDAQREAIKSALKKGFWSKEELLTYYKDYLCFYAHNVNQTTYKNLTQALNTLSNKKVFVNGEPEHFLIRCHRGRGSYARYVFPKSTLINIIREIENESTTKP